MSSLKEVVPKSGLLFQQQALHPVMCKPKLLPLKSVTLEKLEKMQREAQEKVWEMEVKTQEPTEADETPAVEGGQTDVWRAEDEPDAPAETDNQTL